MARCRINFQMGFKNLEWGYGFYIEGDPITLADEYADPLNLAKRNFREALLYMHGGGVELVYVSVADDENPGEGNSRLRYINQANPAAEGSTASRITDVTGNSLLSSMFGPNGGKRKFTMSGLPDAMIERTPSGAAVRTAMFEDAFSVLRPVMLAQNFQIRRTVEPDAGALRRIRLMEPATVSVGEPPVVVEDASHTKFTTTQAHGLAVGDTIDFIHREPTRATEELTGEFKVVEVLGEDPETSTRFVVAARVNFRGASYIPKELYVYVPTYDTENITQWFFDDWGTRKRGEGGGPKGRASSKRKKAV